MKINKTDFEIFHLWGQHLPKIFSSMSLKYNLEAESYNNLLLIPPIQVETSSKNVTNYLNYILADTVSKCYIKNEIYHTTIWGFNSFSTSLEVNSIVDVASQYKNNKELNVNEEISYHHNNLFLKNEKMWWDILNATGIIFPNQMLYYSNDRTVIEIIWFLVSKIWKRHRAELTRQVDLYWPDEGIYLQKDEIRHNDIYFNRKDLKDYVKSHQNLFIENSKQKNILCTFKIKGESAGQLSASILTETNKSIKEQEGLYQSLVSQLLHLKDLGYISKLEKKLELFTSPKDDSLFKIARISRPQWANWEVDEEAVEKIEGIKSEIETVEENLAILEKIHIILENESDIRLISLYNKPYLVASTTALGVNTDEEYSLYYIEKTSEIVVIAEKRSIQILSMVLEEDQKPGPEIEMVLENEVDGGEFFTSLNLPIHKLVSLKGEDLVGLEFEPIFDVKTTDQVSQTNPYNFSVLPIDDLKVDAGTGIYPITPAFSQKDLNLANDYDLPIINTLDEDLFYKYQYNKSNKSINYKRKLKYNSEDLTNHIIDVCFESGHLFAHEDTLHPRLSIKNYDEDLLKKYKEKIESNHNLPDIPGNVDEEFEKIRENVINYESELVKNSYLNWKTKVVEPYTDDLIDVSLTDIKYGGIPLPLWQTKDGNQIYIENINQLIDQSLNPIYTLINSRKLTPDQYANHSIVILGDRNTKLPLGLTAIFYKSNTLSELRRLKQITFADFTNLGPKLLNEVFEIFKKHSTVQLLLEPHEQELLTIWLAGYSPRSEIIEGKFYFYNTLNQINLEDENDEYDLPENVIITQDFGSTESRISKKYFVPDKDFKQLKLQRPYIDEIIIEDGSGRLYERVDHLISNTYLNSILMEGEIWQELIYRPNQLKSFLAYNMEDGKSRSNISRDIFNKNNSILININKFNSYNPYKIDISKPNSTINFPSINPSAKYHNNNFKIDTLVNYLDKHSSDSIRFYLLQNLNSLDLDLNLNTIASKYRKLDSYFEIISKFVINIQNKYPRLNQPLSKNKYSHILNTWLQTYTQNYCLQIRLFLQEGDFDDAANYYEEYLKNLIEWYMKSTKYLDHSFQPEICDCICESLYWFSVHSHPIQPFTTEKLYQLLPVTKWSDHSCFSHPFIDFKEPSLSQIETLDAFLHVKEIITSVAEIRERNKIKLKQPLYCDVSRLNCGQELGELIIRISNLRVKSDGFVDKSTSEIIDNHLGRIKIDIGIYEELSAIGYGWDLERSLIEFMKRNGYKRDGTLVFKLKIKDTDNDDMVYKAVNSTDWSKLNIEVRWDKDIKEGKIIEISDLAKILIQKVD